MRSSLARLLFWRKPDDRFRDFAETEAFGARDLARAAEQTEDPWVRRQLILHAQDEVRHARLLDEQSPQAPSTGLGASMIAEDQPADGIDLAEMGEIGFLAFVHEAEKRATREFGLHRDALGARGQFFESILADEKRHVAWTGHALDRHRAAGRADEVKRALRQVRRQRWMGLWLAFARRLSLLTSALLLGLLYVVALGPFALLAGRWKSGWLPAAAPTPLDRQF